MKADALRRMPFALRNSEFSRSNSSSWAVSSVFVPGLTLLSISVLRSHFRSVSTGIPSFWPMRAGAPRPPPASARATIRKRSACYLNSGACVFTSGMILNLSHPDAP